MSGDFLPDIQTNGPPTETIDGALGKRAPTYNILSLGKQGHVPP